MASFLLFLLTALLASCCGWAMPLNTTASTQLTRLPYIPHDILRTVKGFMLYSRTMALSGDTGNLTIHWKRTGISTEDATMISRIVVRVVQEKMWGRTEYMFERRKDMLRPWLYKIVEPQDGIYLSEVVKNMFIPKSALDEPTPDELHESDLANGGIPDPNGHPNYNVAEWNEPRLYNPDTLDRGWEADIIDFIGEPPNHGHTGPKVTNEKRDIDYDAENARQANNPQEQERLRRNAAAVIHFISPVILKLVRPLVTNVWDG